MNRPARNRSGLKAWRSNNRASRCSTIDAGGARGMAELPMRLERILVPVDFSNCSQIALQYAAAVAREFNAQLTLLHVTETTPYERAMPGFRREIYEEAQARLKTLARDQADCGVTPQCVVRTGRPWQQIVREAAASGADVVIVGTRGRTGLKHVFLGSVAERVVRHAPCPVLVARETQYEPSP